MNRFRSLALVTMLAAALVASTHYTANAATTDDKQEQQNSSSRVDQHLRVLSEKLELTADQQAELRPIIQKMFDSQQKLMQDKSLSDEERHQKMRTLHESAAREARQYLNDNQNKKLEQLETDSHHPSHAN